ncbi:TonB-dependent receptor precursor [Sphingobium chlorophenolicum]|uniref:TonB-dependent receptor n=2 Tax=Sphingobium chlorophenolicum TaxID=46429 RepID=A0A081RAV4_SPHCR|nr:TonB-dependent receptor precursor [Sphingobium chlorophenolicum]
MIVKEYLKNHTVGCIAILSTTALTSVMALPALAQNAPASPPAAASSGQNATAIEDIVVTAQRRSERLQDVPVAVTAASAAKLAAVGIASTQELTVVTPGLSMPQTAGYSQPRIRGIGSSTNGPGQEPPIATYIDGVYLAAAPASLLTLNNIDRVEVLKGPQGTLFGRNATGGLIQVVTKDPSEKPTAAFNLSYAKYNDITADAYVSGPIADAFRADLALHYETQQSGWGTNLGTGNPAGTLPHDFAGRAKFLFEPGADTSIVLAVDYADRVSRRDVQKLDERLFQGTFNNPLFGGPFPQGGKYDINNNIDPENRLKAKGVSLHIKQELGGATLQSITAYRDTKFDINLDIDQTPIKYIQLFASSRMKQFSQELQLSSDSSGPLTWTGGLYFYHADDSNNPLQVDFPPTAVSPVPFAPVSIRTDSKMRTNSFAGYAQGTYEFLPETRLTLGGRFTYERKHSEGGEDFIVGGAVAQHTTFPAPGIVDTIKANRFTYRIALDHKFTPDILGYVSYNTGFKSGGYNLSAPTNPPYKLETIKAAEVGLKSDLFNRRLRLNMAAYHYDYGNLQVGRYFNNVQTVYNGAKAEIYGVDLDGEVIVAQGLSLNGGFSYIHAEFKSFPLADYIVPCEGQTPTPGHVVTCSAAGNRLPFTPKTTFNIGADYKVDVSFGTLEAHATYYRASSVFAAPDNVATEPAYDLVNASMGWTDLSGQLSVKVWGKNLGNSYYATSMLEANQGVIRANGAPRTYGVTLGYKF